jgi:hypothetical protein
MDYDSFKDVLQNQSQLRQISVIVLHIFDQNKVDDIVRGLKRDRLECSIKKKVHMSQQLEVIG